MTASWPWSGHDKTAHLVASQRGACHAAVTDTAAYVLVPYPTERNCWGGPWWFCDWLLWYNKANLQDINAYGRSVCQCKAVLRHIERRLKYFGFPLKLSEVCKIIDSVAHHCRILKMFVSAHVTAWLCKWWNGCSTYRIAVILCRNIEVKIRYLFIISVVNVGAHGVCVLWCVCRMLQLRNIATKKLRLMNPHYVEIPQLFPCWLQ